MSEIDRLEQQILELVNRLFSVTSVGPETTKAVLERLINELEIKLAALESEAQP